MKFYLMVIFAAVCGIHGLLEEVPEVSVEALLKRVQKLEQTCLQCNQNQTGPVAFNAYLSKTYTNLGQHQHIVFDHVTLNIGNGYNHLHGHFTAPVPGLYIFFVMITNVIGHSSSVHLVKNGQMIGRLLADDIPNAYVTSTLPVTVQLGAGDRVWAQNEETYSTVEELDGSSWSSFSGHLINAY